MTVHVSSRSYRGATHWTKLWLTEIWYQNLHSMSSQTPIHCSNSISSMKKSSTQIWIMSLIYIYIHYIYLIYLHKIYEYIKLLMPRVAPFQVYWFFELFLFEEWNQESHSKIPALAAIQIGSQHHLLSHFRVCDIYQKRFYLIIDK